jgi:hypothetical protein
MFIVLGIESLSFIINFGVVIVHFAVSVGLSGEGFLLLRCVRVYVLLAHLCRLSWPQEIRNLSVLARQKEERTRR